MLIKKCHDFGVYAYLNDACKGCAETTIGESMSKEEIAKQDRANLVGGNRLELLLFKVHGEQIYGINVFKVREVLQCPELTSLPNSHEVVRGVAHIRSSTIPVIDISMATGSEPLKNPQECFVIIAEYSGKVQGFLVSSVERIINLNWEEIHPPPKGAGANHYLTAVTHVDKKMVEIIDVERILAEVSPINEEVSEGIIEENIFEKAARLKVLMVDDSKIARKQISRCLDKVGVQVVTFENGAEAWNHLNEIADSGHHPKDEYLMLISDIEMPEMDGYTLVSKIKEQANLKDLFVVLHSSLSGVFNNDMVKKVGADEFIAKFDPDILANLVAKHVADVS